MLNLSIRELRLTRPGRQLMFWQFNTTINVISSLAATYLTKETVQFSKQAPEFLQVHNTVDSRVIDTWGQWGEGKRRGWVLRLTRTIQAVHHGPHLRTEESQSHGPRRRAFNEPSHLISPLLSSSFSFSFFYLKPNRIRLLFEIESNRGINNMSRLDSMAF